MRTSPSSSHSVSTSPLSTLIEETTSASSPSESLQKRREEFIRSLPPSLTDWARVFADADSDAPVAYNPDDDDELYDPNDDAAVEAFWMQAAREGRVTQGIGKDAVVLKPEDLGFDK